MIRERLWVAEDKQARQSRAASRRRCPASPAQPAGLRVTERPRRPGARSGFTRAHSRGRPPSPATSEDPAMIRFLIVRILPGDSGALRDEHGHLRHHQRAARRLRRLHPQPADQPGQRAASTQPTPPPTPTARRTGSTSRCSSSTVHWIGGIVTARRLRHRYFYNRPVGDVVGERLPRTIALALTCHLLATLFGIGSRHPRRTRQYQLGRHRALDLRLPRHDDPALPDGADHPLLARLQARTSQDFGSFFSPQYGGAPWSLGQVRGPREARLADHLRRRPSAGSPTTCG